MITTISNKNLQNPNNDENLEFDVDSPHHQQSQQIITESTIKTTTNPVKSSSHLQTIQNQNHLNSYQKQQLISNQSLQTTTEIIDSVIESNIQTAEEARNWLTPESITEICKLPEMVAIGNDPGNQLNWLIVVGTHAVSQHLGTFVVAVSQVIFYYKKKIN